MKPFLKYLVLFIIGGLGYLLIEILFSGRTHWTMGLLGGICFILIGSLNNLFSFEMSIISQMAISSFIITSLELFSGIILNIWLGLNIWDYSALPFNLMGQICLPFTVLWFFLSLLAIVTDDFIRWKLFSERKPHYKLY